MATSCGVLLVTLLLYLVWPSSGLSEPETSLSGHGEEDATDTALSAVKDAETYEDKHGVYVMCNGKFCQENQTMMYGDEISCYFEPMGMIERMDFFLVVQNNLVANRYPCRYVIMQKLADPSTIWCRALSEDYGIDYYSSNGPPLNNVACANPDDDVWNPAYKPATFSMDVMCKGSFCKDDEIMSVGDEIACNFEPTSKHMESHLGFTLLIDGNAIVKGYPCTHVLREEDVGTKLIECQVKIETCAAYRKTQSIDVVCDFLDKSRKMNNRHAPFSMDVMCNGKLCQDNETMRFGDEISCNFEPIRFLDRLTFTLLIDGYAIVEGYPCTHVLREEDVGTKLIECHANGTKCGPYNKTQNITVDCAFRDDVVVKPVKRTFDVKAYEVIFNRTNATHPPELVILCGDEPCDKPGRIIYVGTFVTCRMRDGQMNNLMMRVNTSPINAQMPVIVSEIVYQLKAKDTNSSFVQCYGHRPASDVNFVNITNATFPVFAWPCSNVNPGRAEIKDAAGAIDGVLTEKIEHGEAAGAIDGGQTEKIDEEPAARNKDGPKWNDDEEPAAGNKVGPKQNDGISAEKSAKDDESKPNSGNGQGGFVLLQLFLAFIAAYVGLGQF